ncbi:metal ABC transporter ATP-binding protein [Nakamurella multipartita]|jgi:zinc/manganese transport system ATP-binding protein|uniref:ABC transporter related n=1 Tax=Nakamurella multipartita (strain ATCC 700099 / DSM 44233 / CIP 104796 / JCM 9543 / NBRC 105858 / Y-104) TaxID=479431 RepID=C8X9Z6_NAKMY|nr:metal ABC transporter ATP-binding protein [Nakamurella multipartita]ACV81196.1 ABC transporter related [Nakamurella multipartita DSM 44233]
MTEPATAPAPAAVRPAPAGPAAPANDPPALQLRDAGLGFGRRTLWTHLDLSIARGEFVAVLGSNGSGKTSLLRTILGEVALTSGSGAISGRPLGRGSTDVGYVPQKIAIDAATMIKARDVVRMGLDGHRWGLPVAVGARRRRIRSRIDELLESVGAGEFGDAPVSMLSGGELQRIRVAAALASDPVLLLCDEPLAALDLRHQQDIAALIDAQRRLRGTAVLFVTHDINPVLPYVDQVLYLAGGSFRLGRPDEVLTSAGLSELYGAPVDVLRAQGRIIVVSSTEAVGHQSHDDHAATELGGEWR